MTLFGNLFREPGAGPDPPVLTDVPFHRQIAERMAFEMTNDAQFAGVTASQVNDPKRVLRDMVAGDVVVDCIGIGVRSAPLNRKQYQREYITHVALRSKITEAQITDAILDELGLLSQMVQTFFEETKRTIPLESPDRANLLKAEPFTHVSRQQLYADGVFVCPIEFTWKYVPG